MLILTTFDSINSQNFAENIVLIVMVISASILNGYIFGIIIDYIYKVTMGSQNVELRASDLSNRTVRYQLGVE